jgi:hypothetical protein
MAKKNRSPRTQIGEVYLDVGEIIPGTDRKAEKSRWYYPEDEEGFSRPKWTAWRRELEAQWQKERDDAMVANGLMIP